MALHTVLFMVLRDRNVRPHMYCEYLIELGSLAVVLATDLYAYILLHYSYTTIIIFLTYNYNPECKGCYYGINTLDTSH